MKLDSRLVEVTKAFIQNRFPAEGWAGAAGMYTADGDVLISTAPEVVNASVEVCHETGAICEAYKLSKKITASVCVSRDDKGLFHISTPCGVCQERLKLDSLPMRAFTTSGSSKESEGNFLLK